MSSSLALKSLRILSKAAFDLTSTLIPVGNKGTEKLTLLSYLRGVLPDTCSRGYNFHVDIESMVDEIKTRVNTTDLPMSEERLSVNENIIVGIFGHKSPSLKDVKKLNGAKITLLATHLGGEMGVDIPTAKKELLPFCLSNLWRVNNLWEDVKEAMVIGQKAFMNRIGEFKRTLKNLLRIVNEQYGGFSMKFRMNFVIKGLLNFVQHFCESHIDCPRFFWWTQCSDTHLKYTPAQDYCTVISSGRRGPGCRDLIPVFFKIFVHSFVMSRYCEVQLWKCISFSKTTVCESYFHWKGIMIPKWQNITPLEYERKETAAFVAFATRQKEKKFLLKKLVKSKYAATLTVATAHKNNRYEKHILDAIMDVCGCDPSVAAAVEHYTNKYNTRQKRRQTLQDKVISNYEQDETAKNLNLGPTKHQWRTSDSEGCISGKEFSEYELSARPVPPFPFVRGDLLDESQLHRIKKVWESSRALRRERRETDEENEEVDIDRIICNCCEEEMITIEIKCSFCVSQIHSECYETNNSTEWEINVNGEIMCKNCSGINRMGSIN